jgi:KDO2-lipid IV(A) lauroyltransferase
VGHERKAPDGTRKSGRGVTRFWQRIVVAALAGTSGLMQRLPAPTAARFGRGLGRLGYRVAARQRHYAARNLRLTRFLGEADSPAARDDLTHAAFAHFGQCLVEFLRGPALAGRDLDTLVRCDGWEHMERARRDKNGSVIILSAHLGNWEILGRWLAHKGLPLTVVAREPEAPPLAVYMRRMREGAGFAVLSKGKSARELLAVLRRGEAIFLMPDQNSGDVFVPFFGVPAGTVAGPASLALHTGAPILPVYCLREKDGSFRVLIQPPVPVETSGDRDADVARIMTAMNARLEGVIRDYPDQWLWLHNRWKSAFEEKNRDRWPAGYDFAEAHARWVGP